MIGPHIENVLLVLILVIGFLIRLPYNNSPGDPDEFYAAIKQLVINEGLKTEMGNQELKNIPGAKSWENIKLCLNKILVGSV